MGLNILTNSEFTFQRRECGGVFRASTQSSREQNSALTSQLHTVETATLEPFPINYIKQANPKATVLTSFLRESPGNQSFADLVIKPALNYRTRRCESQYSTRRRDKREDKMQWTLTGELLPASGEQAGLQPSLGALESFTSLQ